MSKVDLVGIAQDLFLLNDLSYKYAVGKTNEILNIYFYRTSLEGEMLNIFVLETNNTKIVIPASNDWDNLGINGLYKITCKDCEGKFIFKEYNNIQTIKSASTLYISPIKDNEWEIEYSVLDDKIRRFNMINQLQKQDSSDWTDDVLNIIFSDTAEILAEKVPTIKILAETAKSILNYIDKTNRKHQILGYIKIYNNEIAIDLEDKGANYYVVNLEKLNKCFLYQQYIMLFYIKTRYIYSTYTEIRLVNYNDARYMVLINQNDEMIIDITFTEVIDILVREETESSDKGAEVGQETNTSIHNTEDVGDNTVHDSL